jgi:peptidoglycan hydrolase-like protein with peptidoglycan-binding domain
MRKYILGCILVLVIFTFCFSTTGCKRKEVESPLKSQLPDSSPTLTVTADEGAAPIQKGEKIEAVSTETEVNKEVSASQETTVTDITTPTSEEIQTALKNAGYYTGDIDGKIGPKSKQAIIDFQKDNDLETDGKVGPKTWSKLKEYLTSQKQSD